MDFRSWQRGADPRHRIFRSSHSSGCGSISCTMREPSISGLMLVPPLCPQATGTSFTLKPNLRARKRISGSNPQRSIFWRRKDGFDGGAPEGFEATLRVGEVKAERETQDQVEDAAEELAVQGLALGLSFGAQPAGTDGNVGACVQRVKELWGLFDRARTGRHR